MISLPILYQLLINRSYQNCHDYYANGSFLCTHSLQKHGYRVMPTSTVMTPIMRAGSQPILSRAFWS